MTAHKMTVAVWNETDSSCDSEPCKDRRSLVPHHIGLTGTLLLHALVLSTMLPGERTHQIRVPVVREFGTLPGTPAVEPADNLIFIDLSRGEKSDGRLIQVHASFGPKIKSSELIVRSSDLLPLTGLDTPGFDGQEKIDAGKDNFDGAKRVGLTGVYYRQMQARIERVWRKPRTPVVDRSDPKSSGDAADYFLCQAQIIQDSGGKVQEILLPNCNGSASWQRSLVVAIQQSSPLPTPPDPKVFDKTIVLNFIGYPYVTGAPDDGYDIEPIKIAGSISQ